MVTAAFKIRRTSALQKCGLFGPDDLVSFKFWIKYVTDVLVKHYGARCLPAPQQGSAPRLPDCPRTRSAPPPAPGHPHGHNHGNSLTADAVASPEVFPSANPNPACPQLLPTHPSSAAHTSPRGDPSSASHCHRPPPSTLVVGLPAPPELPASQRGTQPPQHTRAKSRSALISPRG